MSATYPGRRRLSHLLPLTVLFVLAGLLLGRGGLEWIDLSARSDFVRDLALVALIVILFRDGLEVEGEMLQSAWHLPLRKLVLAMPITAIVVAAATSLLTDLSWTESFLVGALLSPTDPVLTSSVVTNPRVPRIVRHSLNLESGLNDGLALPAVLAFLYALDPAKSDFSWWQFVLRDVLLGFAVGIAAGAIASRVGVRGRAAVVYGLAVAFGTYGIAHAIRGNGLIAVFVGAITLGLLRDEIRVSFERHAEYLLEAVKLGIFFVFGAVITLHGLFQDGFAAAGIVAITLLVARPVAVGIALLRTRTDLATRLFMSWFGPKGVATMTFSLLVLAQGIPEGERIANLAALAVFTSIIVHGLTDHPGSEWMARHAERSAA